MENPNIALERTAIDETPRQPEPHEPVPGGLGHAGYQWLKQWAELGERRLARWAQPEVACWRLGLIFGLLFLVVTPPFQAPDEWAHFCRAYQLADGKVLPLRLDAPAVGAEMPRSVETTIIDVVGKVIGNSQEKQSADKILANLARPLNPHDIVFVDFRAVALNSPLPYLPQAVGIRLGRFFNLAPLGMSYTGRLVNFFTALLLTGLAIRLLPLMKWGLLLLAMTPMAVFQRSSLSPDALLNALAFLFIALVVRAAWPRAGRLGRGELVLLGVTAVALGLCKPPYYMLTLLCLMIPRARFGGTKRYLAATGGILVAGALALMLWGTLVRELYLPVVGAPNTLAAEAAGADPKKLMAEQVRFLVQHPLRLVPVFRDTIKQRWSGYYLSFIGILGWLDTMLPFNLYYSYTLFLLLVVLLDGDRQGAFGWRLRAWILVVLALSLLGLGISLYVQWTPTGAGIIDGLSGRYFIALSPLFALPLCLRRGTIDLAGQRLHWLVIGYLMWALSVALNTLAHRYYLPAGA